MKTENEIPRRNRLDQFHPVELSIYNIVGEVEKIGASIGLTNAIVKLNEARALIADYIDENKVKCELHKPSEENRARIMELLWAFSCAGSTDPKEITEEIIRAAQCCEPKLSENIGQTNEEFVEKISNLIEEDLLNIYVPHWEDEDGDPIQLKDLLSNTNTVDSGIENIHDIVDSMNAPFQIAKLLPPFRNQENGVNTEQEKVLRFAEFMCENYRYFPWRGWINLDLSSDKDHTTKELYDSEEFKEYLKQFEK